MAAVSIGGFSHYMSRLLINMNMI